MNNKRLQQELDALRQRIESEASLQARLAGLHRQVLNLETAALGEDEEMLTFLVSEALAGVDIRQRYPAAFEQLLNDSDLQELFLVALESYENAAVAEEILPTSQPAGAMPQAIIQPTPQPDAWQARWQLPADFLSRLFFTVEPVFRDALAEEERWHTLLRQEIQAGETLVEVVLDARLNDDEQLEPELKIAAESSTRQPVQVEVSGQLAWGDLRQAIQPTRAYRTTLLPIPLAGRLDISTRHAHAALELTLSVRTIASD